MSAPKRIIFITSLLHFENQCNLIRMFAKRLVFSLLTLATLHRYVSKAASDLSASAERSLHVNIGPAEISEFNYPDTPIRDDLVIEGEMTLPLPKLHVETDDEEVQTPSPASKQLPSPTIARGASLDRFFAQAGLKSLDAGPGEDHGVFESTGSRDFGVEGRSRIPTGASKHSSPHLPLSPAVVETVFLEIIRPAVIAHRSSISNRVNLAAMLAKMEQLAMAEEQSEEQEEAPEKEALEKDKDASEGEGFSNKEE